MSYVYRTSSSSYPVLEPASTLSIKMSNQILPNDADSAKPHFVLVPFLAQGHMIPMIDMAHLLADHGATVTIITTPINIARINSIVKRVAESKLPIRFVPVPFPCSEMGLPEGCENLDAVPSVDLLVNFMEACVMLREPLTLLLRQQKPMPSCIISDAGHFWTHEVAREFEIPRLTFNGFGCFTLLCRHIICYDKMLEKVTDDDQIIVIPGLPHRIELTKAQAPTNFGGKAMEAYRKKVMEVELMADGIVVNSFDDLDPLYVENYQKVTGKKVCTIGPLSLYHRNDGDMVTRGNKASIDEGRCSMWLDSMGPASVIYVSFGSLAFTTPLQLIEIGLGLEASECPFIWVIKAGNKASVVEEWLLEGFEERTRSKGLIIRGWAPQLMILSHSAIGGFVTHCGWNSVLESASASVPMITWPHFADQFLNEKLIVEVLRIGIGVGVKEPFRWGMDNNEVTMSRDDVTRAVCRVMSGGGEAKGMRERARVVGEKAKMAMERGGSSYDNIKAIVQQTQNFLMKKKNLSV